MWGPFSASNLSGELIFNVRHGKKRAPKGRHSTTVLSGVRPNVKNREWEITLPTFQSLAYTFSYVSNQTPWVSLFQVVKPARGGYFLVRATTQAVLWITHNVKTTHHLLNKCAKANHFRLNSLEWNSGDAVKSCPTNIVG